jgi:3-(methylthio)propionyl---CoA ligase
MLNHVTSRALTMCLGRQLRPLIPTVTTFIVMTDRAHMPPPNPAQPLLCYEELIKPCIAQLPFRWEVTDENSACGMCYTSGTTGRPKVSFPLYVVEKGC